MRSGLNQRRGGEERGGLWTVDLTESDGWDEGRGLNAVNWDHMVCWLKVMVFLDFGEIEGFTILPLGCI